MDILNFRQLGNVHLVTTRRGGLACPGLLQRDAGDAIRSRDEVIAPRAALQCAKRV